MKHSSPLAGSLPSSSEAYWKELYMAALFENDKSKIARKIAEAQLSIVAQRRKTLATGTSIRERQALDAALLSLQALANCLPITQRSIADVRAAHVQAEDVRAASLRTPGIRLILRNGNLNE